MAGAEMANKKGKFGDGFFSFAGAILVVLSIRWLLFEPYVIPSGSMLPTLLIHDHILVNKLAFGVRVPFTKSWLFRFGEPKRGDILVFRSVEDDGYFMIKRVVGVPGDTLEFTEEGQLIVNGEPTTHEPMGDSEIAAKAAPFYSVSEKDLEGSLSNFRFFSEKMGNVRFRTLLKQDGFRWRVAPFKIPPGKLYMMGDNRDNSKDSRYWGELPEENVLGRALFVWLSCEDTFSFASFLCNPATIRWKRFFHGIE